MGVDEFLLLCKEFKALSDAFPDDWVSPDDHDDDNRDSDNDNRDSCSRRGGVQTGKAKEWEVEEILNVRVCDEAVRLAKGAVKRTLFPQPTTPTTPSSSPTDSWDPACCCKHSCPQCVAGRLKCISLSFPDKVSLGSTPCVCQVKHPMPQLAFN